MMSREPIIETSGLVIGYTQKGKRSTVVHDSLSLQLFSGELTSLLGLNGAGKSTLLRTLGGFQPALGGTIRLKTGNYQPAFDGAICLKTCYSRSALHGAILPDDRLLSDYSPSELSQTIGVVLTEKTNAGGITVFELVSLGRYPYTGFFGTLKATDTIIVAESLEAVCMAHKASCFVSELSDGERQKAMIAKVLAQQCPIILLDEPTAFLDVASRIETMTLLHRLSVEQHKAILLSTHDLDLALQMSDRLWLLDKNRPVVCGTPEDLILSGYFETFFNKTDILFDISTGKLTAPKPSFPIAVEGDAITAYWVSNALLRNGFRPSSKDETDIRIYCHDPSRISLFLKDSDEVILNCITDLICALSTYETKPP